MALFSLVPRTVAQLMINVDGTSFQTGGGLCESVGVKYLKGFLLEKGGPLECMAQKRQSLISEGILCPIENPLNISLQLILKAHLQSENLYHRR